MKIKKTVYTMLSLILCIVTYSEVKVDNLKNELNNIGNDVNLIISSQMGVNEDVYNYLKSIDEEVELSYSSNQMLAKGEIFYYQLRKKTPLLFVKSKEVVIYKSVILGAYSLK